MKALVILYRMAGHPLGEVIQVAYDPAVRPGDTVQADGRRYQVRAVERYLPLIASAAGDQRMNLSVSMDGGGPFCPGCGKDLATGSWGDRDAAVRAHQEACYRYHLYRVLAAKRKRITPPP